MQGISGKIGLCAPPLHNWQNGMLQSVEECSEVAGDILESVFDNIDFEIENIFLLGGFSLYLICLPEERYALKRIKRGMKKSIF